MWLLAVPAFYYQLRMPLNVANDVEHTMYERFRTSMLSHVKFGKHLLAFPTVPPDLRMQALQEFRVMLEGIVTTLTLDVSSFVSGES